MSSSQVPVLLSLPVYAALWGMIFYGRLFDFWWSISVVSALVILAALWFGYRRGALEAWFAVTRRRLAVGVLVGVALYLLFRVGFTVLNLAWPVFIGTQVAALYGLTTGMSPLVLSILVGLLVIPGEELYWRGVVQPAAIGYLGPRGGIATATVLYAAVNGWSGNPLQVLAGLVCGWVWGVTAWRTGGLIAPLVAHLLWDLALLIWFPL